MVLSTHNIANNLNCALYFNILTAYLRTRNKFKSLHREECVQGEDEIRRLTDKSTQFKQCVELATSITGIGEVTAAAILAEVGCFSNFSNQRQAISFAGLDVIARQSGPHDPKRHISKQGNTSIRLMLYICAMTAIRFNPKVNVPLSALTES